MTLATSPADKTPTGDGDGDGQDGDGAPARAAAACSSRTWRRIGRKLRADGVKPEEAALRVAAGDAT